MKKEVNPVELDFLLRFPFKAGVASPVDFLLSQGWGGIKVCLRRNFILVFFIFATERDLILSVRSSSTIHN